MAGNVWAYNFGAEFKCRNLFAYKYTNLLPSSI